MNLFREIVRTSGGKEPQREEPASAQASPSTVPLNLAESSAAAASDFSGCPFIGHREYEPLKELFGPVLGQVFLARRQSSGSLVVLKLIERGPTVSHFVRSELLLHARCAGHPHILQLLDVFLTDTHLAIVLEHAAAGDLAALVATSGALPEARARTFFQQSVSALAHLHSMGATQREARLESRLLVPGAGPGADLVVKVQDFAYSKTEQINSDPNSALGSLPYTAPEVLGNAVATGSAVDIWAMGVFLYRLTLGRFPFERPEDAPGQRDVVQRILGRIARAEYVVPDGLSPDLYDLLSKMLVRLPEQRLSLQGVMAHPWFREGLPPALLAPMELSRPLWNEAELLSIIGEASKRISSGLDVDDMADEILNEEEIDDLLDELDLGSSAAQGLATRQGS